MLGNREGGGTLGNQEEGGLLEKMKCTICELQLLSFKIPCFLCFPFEKISRDIIYNA